MKMLKTLLSAACALCGTALFAQTTVELDNLLPADVVSQLKKDGKIEQTVYMNDYTVNLFPRTELGKEASSVWENSGKTTKPVFYYEALFLTKKETPTEPGKNIPDLSKVVRSISSLEGIQYYSNTRKKMRDLYEESYTVNNPQEKVRIADPVEGSADGLKLFALQKDSTFGKFVYEYSYRQTETELLTKTANVDALSLIGIKIIQPDNLLLSLLVTDLGDYYLMYTLVETDVISLSMIENKLKVSFAARVEALHGWLSDVYVDLDKKNAAALAAASTEAKE